MTRKLYLVRHAQSVANTEREALYHRANMAMGLTPKGHAQALRMADRLLEFLLPEKRVVLWVSPYQRAIETARAIKHVFNTSAIAFSWEERESIYLAERQFGLVDTHAGLADTHGAELDHYRLNHSQGFGFWARPPLGESPFDVCLRADFFLKSVLSRDADAAHVLVSHGMTIRAIQMMELGLAARKYDQMHNPTNASVRLLEDGVDRGEVIHVSSEASVQMAREMVRARCSAKALGYFDEAVASDLLRSNREIENSEIDKDL
jgi:broad specificity phosphatase PhoE